MKPDVFLLTTLVALPLSLNTQAANTNQQTSAGHLVAEQRQALAINTEGQGFGPQSPRNIDSVTGRNPVSFSIAPHSGKMNLCNIHFHKNAEHKGGEFTTYAGPGDGHGYQTGYRYSGKLTRTETAPVRQKICSGKHGSLQPGDTIEVHYVYSTAQIQPGPTLASCFNNANKNPQLRVETQVYVLVNDSRAPDFKELAKYDKKDDLYQALNIPQDTGNPVVYNGSTTGPGYNEIGSPYQVTWSVRPDIKKVNIKTVGKWCQGNVFKEDHAHGVRNLVINPNLLSTINND